MNDGAKYGSPSSTYHRVNTLRKNDFRPDWPEPETPDSVVIDEEAQRATNFLAPSSSRATSGAPAPLELTGCVPVPQSQKPAKGEA